MGTFPYPYMNGRLHLGHSFTVSKVEFACAFQRLKGKRVLFPFGFHCTGMPIKACADKLRDEIAAFGNPPQFPQEEEHEEEHEEAKPEEAKPEEAKPEEAKPEEGKHESKVGKSFHSRKTKVAQKGGKSVYQWNIMKSIGLSDDEIAPFADPLHWLNFFPPATKADLIKFGAGVDWRRSFITTEVNPFYDSFVRWQFETLRDLGKVKFGTRYAVYSPKDGQPCADHDRASGENVRPQEYTNIKLQVVEPVPEKLKPIKEKGLRIFLVASTLRPETMYGQTNCWILPEGEYGVFQVSESEAFVCSDRAARNMAFQGFSRVPGQVEKLGEVKGAELIGCPLKAPLTKYEVIYCLPMFNVLMDKGTGIVTSVPSDAPHDYAAYMDLRRKEALRQKFGVKDEWIMPFELIPIISTEELGNLAAVKVCEEKSIKSQNDADQLEKAREVCYQLGFYKGIMLLGEHAGKPVREAKTLVRDMLVETGQAAPYAEPEALVVSRSGDICVVANTDQWYIPYGEAQWKEKTKEWIDKMEFYEDETRRGFEFALDWLDSWACSRSFGLGTRLPWDPQYLIESLSDSTIYMAYYTVAHYLHADFNGQVPGKAGIKAEQMTRGVWDHILLGKDVPADCAIPVQTLAQMKKEFDFWYPMDLRVSGKDLINNHLTFCVYNHTAIFANEKWPRTMRANGHLLLNDKKMSKSTGNFMTMSDGVDKFGADAMRFTLAEAGDGLEDANFKEVTANAAVLRLYNYIEWCQEVLAPESFAKLRNGEFNFHDRVFMNDINQAIAAADAAYQRTRFREALISGFHDFQTARDQYRSATQIVGLEMHAELVRRFVQVQTLLIAPITPHLSDFIWTKVLRNQGHVVVASWPEIEPIDRVIAAKSDYLKNNVLNFRAKLTFAMKPKKGKPVEKPKTATILAAREYPEWQKRIYQILNENYKPDTPELFASNKDLAAKFAQDPVVKPKAKNAMAFAATIIGEVKARGAEALQSALTFDELAFLNENVHYIAAVVGLESIELKEEENATTAAPGKPNIIFPAN
jgi:leucyl-tRNA synthetase